LAQGQLRGKPAPAAQLPRFIMLARNGIVAAFFLVSVCQESHGVESVAKDSLLSKRAAASRGDSDTSDDNAPKASGNMFGFHNFFPGGKPSANVQPEAPQMMFGFHQKNSQNYVNKYMQLVRHEKKDDKEESRLAVAEQADLDQAHQADEEEKARLQRQEDMQRAANEDKRRREAELEFKDVDDEEDDPDEPHVDWARADHLRGWESSGWTAPKPAGHSSHHQVKLAPAIDNFLITGSTPITDSKPFFLPKWGAGAPAAPMAQGTEAAASDSPFGHASSVIPGLPA